MKLSSIGIHIRYDTLNISQLNHLISYIDQLGFDCIYVADQLASYFEPMELLSYIAGRTQNSRQGTCIYLIPLRNPFYVAKKVATIQRLSGRLFTLGVGVGWRKGEFDTLGIDWSNRGRLADEELQILKMAWEKDIFSFKGKFFTAENLDLNSKLDKKPEILVGGNSNAAMKRAALYGDGWIPTDFTVEEYRNSLKMMYRILQSHGRQNDSFKIASHLLLCLAKDINSAYNLGSKVAREFGVQVDDMKEWSLFGSPEVVSERIASYNSAGVNYHVLALPPSITLDEAASSLQILAKDVVPSV